jgi:N utilization substance protein B
MSRRRKAREIALQVLYAVDLSGVSWEVALEDTITRRSSGGEAADYARKLLERTVNSTPKLDEMISGRLENWEFDRVSIIDRNILRIALAELVYFPDTPTKVIIDEAIEISRRFSSREAGRFVNGILDRLAGEVRED